MSNVSVSVIMLGHAVLGENGITVREQQNILNESTLAELIACKLILEQYHAEDLYAMTLVMLFIRIKERAIVRHIHAA